MNQVHRYGIKIKRRIINMFLNKKFMTIVIAVVIVMMMAAYIAIHIIDQSYQKMLYEEQRKSLESSIRLLGIRSRK